MKFVPKTILTVTSVGALSLVATLVAGVSFAAPNEPPPPSPPGPVPPGLPIDNGLIVLIIMAAALGFYKIHQMNRNKKAQM